MKETGRKPIKDQKDEGNVRVTGNDDTVEVEMTGKDIPLTINGIIKWTGVIATAVGALVSVVLAYAKLASEIQSFHEQEVTDKAMVDLRMENENKDIDMLKLKAAQTDKDVADINRKLDVAVAILDRIEVKVNNPKGQ
jgi:hypothetical protein